jgi:hypothetical protein
VKAADVVQQIQASIGTMTGLSQSATPSTIIKVSGNTWQLTTGTAHGLSVGELFSLGGVETPTLITDSYIDGDTIVCTTAVDHDLSLYRGESKTVKIGVNTYSLLGVPNRLNFVIANVGSPDLEGEYLFQTYPYGLNDIHQVITVPNSTTIRFDLSPDFEFMTAPISTATVKINTKFQVSAAVDIETANNSYTAQSANSIWLFVVLGDYFANKNRLNTNDAQITQGMQGDYYHQIISNMSVYAFLPNKGTSPRDQNGRKERDYIETTIRPFLFRALLRVNFPTYLSCQTQSTLSYNGDSFQGYTGAYYVHKFDFQQVIQVTNDDTNDTYATRAFRDLYLTFKNQFSDVTEYTADVNIDEVLEDTDLGFAESFGESFPS